MCLNNIDISEQTPNKIWGVLGVCVVIPCPAVQAEFSTMEIVLLVLLFNPPLTKIHISLNSVLSLVLDSALPQHMLQLVCSNLELGMGVAVEFAWCLHYIVCR